MSMTRLKRLLTLSLVLIMVLGAMPLQAFAEEGGDVGEIALLREGNFNFEEGPYLYIQYDARHFDLTLTKDGGNIYDSSDGISSEEDDIINGYTTAVELGWYDYVLSLKDVPDCKLEGGFELKGIEWRGYWEYQTEENWGTPTAEVLFNTTIVYNSQPQPAYLVVKDAITGEVITPDYQQMEPEDKGVQLLAFLVGVVSTGDTYLGNGEWAYPEQRKVMWTATPIDPDYEEKVSKAFSLGATSHTGPDMFVKTVYNTSSTFQVPKGSMLRLFRAGAAAYTEHRIFEPFEIDESNPDYDVYKFNSLPNKELAYLLGGWVDEPTPWLSKEVLAKQMEEISTIKVSDLELRDNSKRVDSAYRESNIYQNTPDSSFATK